MGQSVEEAVDSVSRTIVNFADGVAGRRVLLAYSGGVDSHVLLYELAKVELSHGIKVVALHCNHQQSPRANVWEQHCFETCRSLEVKFFSYQLKENCTSLRGQENMLRIARYDWFKSMMSPGDILATAHHLNDQIETLLFRLFRGGGLRGLTGIAHKRMFGTGELHRPLLNLPNSMILEAACYHNLKWVEDPTNVDTSMDRNFIRWKVLPIIQSRWPAIMKTMARSSEHLKRADDLLFEIGQEDLHKLHRSADECRFKNYGKIDISELRNMSLDRSANLLRFWVGGANCEMPGTSKLRELLRQLRDSNRANQARLIWSDLEFRRYRDSLYLLPRQLKRSQWAVETTVSKTGVKLLDAGVRLRAVRTHGCGIRADDFDISDIHICDYTKAANIRLTKTGRARRLSRIFQELGVPPWERWRIPILFIDNMVIYVPGIGPAVEFSAVGEQPGLEFILEER